jgi:outer membrane lipoprotein SlyB
MLKSIYIRRVFGAVAISSALLLGACASDLGANDYNRSSIGQISRSDSGIIVSSRAISIEGTKSGVGTVGGAAIGGIAGSQFGGGRAENAAGAIIGAIVGGLVGSAIENNATETEGFAYTIELDRDGDIITITQAGGYPIPNGTPVWVEYGERARVIPKASQAHPH